ncbi:MAG: response regulator [Myxococcota bacterium]
MNRSKAVKKPLRGKPVVLVVDDYEDAVDIITELLTFEGYEPVVARNGAEALDKAYAQVPDLILMDLSLPELDGWEASRRLKADKRTAHVPIIALTAHALTQHAEKARAAGCDAFVTKPCDPDKLMTEIRRFVPAVAPSTPVSSRE